MQVSDLLYIRSGPGRLNSIKGYLVNNAKVTILEEQEADGMVWGRIDRGWISLSYVKKGWEEETIQPPTTEPPTTVPPTTEPPVTEPPVTEPPYVDDPNAVTGIWTGTVKVKSTLVVRKTPGATGQELGTFTNGQKVTITQQAPASGKVWGRTEKGWICLDYVVMDGETDDDPVIDPDKTPENGSEVFDKPKTMTVNSCSLRIRSGAGVDHEIIGFYSFGDVIQITETKVVGTTVWARTDAGWVKLMYLK